MSKLEMSASGAVMVLAIVVIRALAINRLPKKTFLALWGIALVRLLIPYSLPSALSVYSLLGRLALPAETNPIGTGVSAVWPGIAPVLGTDSAPFASGAQAAPSIMEPYVMIWAAGALVCSLFFAAAYMKCRREFRESLPVDNGFALDWLKEHPLRRTIQIRQLDKISGPLTYGVFRPVILLSKQIGWNDEKTLAYVLAHEYVHIRRFDAVTKLMLTAALCVHWFNPAVWVMYVFANRDMELSCDETVVRLFGEGTRSEYAMTLIRMEETRSGLRPLCNHFSKHAIEERIIAIMKTKKTSLAAVLVALALIAGVTTAFATSAQTQYMMSYDPRDIETGTGTGVGYVQSPTGAQSFPEGISGSAVINDEEEALKYLQNELHAEMERTEEKLAPYLALGLDYHYDLDNVYEPRLTMTWQGKPVRSLFDAERGLFIANSLGDGGLGEDAIDLETVYDSNGNLTGLKTAAN